MTPPARLSAGLAEQLNGWAKRELEADDWAAALERRNGRIVGNESNWMIALRYAREFRDLVHFNEFLHRAVYSRASPWREAAAGEPWGNQDDTYLAAEMQKAGIPTGHGRALLRCVDTIARESTVHPVREYLTDLEHDGRQRLNTWVVDYLGASGAPPVYLGAVGRKFLISAVARIMKPGCQVDHVLVLEGPQGSFKTSAARTLAVREEWFRGELGDASREGAHQLAGKWIIEIAELSALRHSDVERFKSFITQVADDYRIPYAARYEQVPRQCVFIGTTNDRHYLRDKTGNRRYWPVRCGRIEIEALRRDRDQLWAEALALYQAGHMWHLSPEETELASIEQGERMYVPELESDVAEYLAHQREAGITETDVRDVLVHALHLDPDKADYTHHAQRLGRQVSDAMEAAGWHNVGRSKAGGTRRTVYRFFDEGQVGTSAPPTSAGHGTNMGQA
jgi:putative DNA primase/helicase